MSLLDKAKPLSEEVPWIKMVLYGAPGVGKTYWAAQAPEPVFIDFERSTETLRSVLELKDVPVFRPETFKEVMKFVEEVAKTKKFSTIIFDTVSSMQTFYMREYMIEVEKKGGGRDRFLPYQGDYRYATNELTDLWWYCQNMDANVIFIAHEKVVENDQGNIAAIYPLLTPAVRDALSQFINVIGYMEKKTNAVSKTVERNLYLNSTNTILAKNRLGITDQSIKNPKFGDLFNG